MYDVALIEKPGNDGITRADIERLYGLISSEEAYPVEVSAHQVESVAFGFITPSAARSIDYDYGDGSDLGEFVASVMDDMELESDDGAYEACGLSIYLTR